MIYHRSLAVAAFALLHQPFMASGAELRGRTIDGACIADLIDKVEAKFDFDKDTAVPTAAPVTASPTGRPTPAATDAPTATPSEDCIRKFGKCIIVIIDESENGV